MKPKRIIFIILALAFTGGMLMLCLTGCFGAKYNVDYNGSKDSFKGAKDKYTAGASVKLIYRKELIGTDTDYSFYLDNERLNPEYTQNKGYIIRFKMPEHDVKISVKSVNSMVSIQPEEEEYKKEEELSFHSFDGGGPSFDAIIEDESIVKYDYDKKYTKPKHAYMAGAGYNVYFKLKGLKPGATTVKIEARSPIAGNFDYIYDVKVNNELKICVKLRETIDIDAQEYETETVEEPTQ